MSRAALALSLALATAPAAAVVSTVHSPGDSGFRSAMRIKAGRPVIAFEEWTVGLKLATCTAGCSTATPSWVTSTIEAGDARSAGLALLADGRPVVSYTRQGGEVRIATCVGACDLSSAVWVTAPVDAGTVFLDSLAMVDDKPVLAYTDANGSLAYAACTAGCETATPTWVKSVIDPGPGPFVGRRVYPVLRISNGNPVVAYNIEFGEMKLAACTADCYTANPTWVRSTVDGAMGSGGPKGLQVDNGKPVVSYYRAFPDYDLRLATCTADCATASPTWVLAPVDTAGDVGTGNSLQLVAGSPIVSYYDSTNGQLKLATCSGGCATSTPTWKLDVVDAASGAASFPFTSVALDGSTTYISYYDSPGKDLRLAAISGSGPVAQLSAVSMDFGGQSMLTTSPPQSVTLTNSGGAPLAIAAITASDPQFPVAHDCGATLAPLASCTVTVTFLPARGLLPPNAKVPASGQLSIATNATGSPHAVTLSGIREKSLATHYYRTILRRAPDAQGQAFWEGENERMRVLGASENESWFAMAQAFFASSEYAALNRDNVGYVTDLYRTFFNRDPDAGGLAYWVDLRANGMPREVLLVSFMLSPEFVSFTQQIFGNGSARAEVDAVMDFYRGLLSRLPDNSGFQHWVGRFRAAQCAVTIQVIGTPHPVAVEAEAISSAFALSGEYAARGRSHSQYVGDLYNAFLRRGGDLSGVQFWVDQVASGARTREQVRQSFRDSPEFQARVQAITQWGCVQ